MKKSTPLKFAHTVKLNRISEPQGVVIRCISCRLCLTQGVVNFFTGGLSEGTRAYTYSR